ncbi:hypothetical protein N9H39_08775 [Gammaproteobacteria bacterium]|nr:hypothetical protein [Gammaproteobacteria bacterium]
MADTVLSSRRTAEDPARSLPGLSRNQQEFILHWVGVKVSDIYRKLTAQHVEDFSVQVTIPVCDHRAGK